MAKTYAPLGRVINSLECAYAAGWRAMSLAKKLKDAATRKAHRSRIMGRINKLRAELKSFTAKARANWSLFDVFLYSGAAYELVDRGPVTHSNFLRGVK